VYAELLVDLESVMVRLSVKHLSNGKYVKSFLNTEIDACLFFTTTKTVQFLRTWYDKMRCFGKLPTRCPVKKVRMNTSFSKILTFLRAFQDTYFIQNYTSRMKSFPEVLPSDKFQIDWFFSTKIDNEMKIFLNYKAFVAFEPKNKN
jgi:Protein of unknown function (DUF1091)